MMTYQGRLAGRSQTFVQRQRDRLVGRVDRDGALERGVEDDVGTISGCRRAGDNARRANSKEKRSERTLTYLSHWVNSFASGMRGKGDKLSGARELMPRPAPGSRQSWRSQCR